ncbi:MAG: 4Fe-4S dicluster domain-containing protein [Chloroflexota bacterium]|nr:MAG: 4Fe-4S dicluster domain-containing protein [Chloroflexota bacterium]
MPNYGFVIDNRKCIGCHACSTACKSENSVPLGVNRTWVKYVETGAFPSVQRHFQVTRCNHCANPPCVRICPVTAMYQRKDGIVEFDPSVCIGCKACMQACPYDAIYIDPETDTAAKCHFCSHRTEIGLEPACVVVCPEHAILAGDMDDPNSEISRTLATQQVTVRKPEQGTAPKLFYIEGNAWALHPTATERTPETFMFSDVIPLHSIAVNGGNGSNGNHTPALVAEPAVVQGRVSQSGTPLRSLQPQGNPWNGPIQIGGKMAEHMVQVSYNAQHKIPWHWPVPAYLVTKGIGSGILMLLSLALGLRILPFDGPAFLSSIFISLVFIGITTGLLVFDLEKPERFFSILLRPQWRSWLTRGAFILVGLTVVAGVWWLLEAAASIQWLPAAVAQAVRPFAAWFSLPLAVGAAVYTAFLFGQAEGRDLWQSSLLPVHLLIQAAMAGSAALLILHLAISLPEEMYTVALVVFAASLIADLIATLFGEFGMPHGTEVAARAAHEISHGYYKRHFWLGSILLGHAAPLALLLLGLPAAAAAAGAAAIVGLFFFEYAFVMAPQEIPNS